MLHQPDDSQPIALTADEMESIERLGRTGSDRDRLDALEGAVSSTLRQGRLLMDALATTQQTISELRKEFDDHLLEVAPRKEAITAVTRRVASLEQKVDGVDGHGGLVAGMAAVNARTALHTQMLRSLDSGQERIVDILHGKAGIPGLVLRQYAEATRNETIGKVMLVIISVIGTAASVVAVYEPLMKWIARFK